MYEFLIAAGARVRVNDAGRDHGQIRAFANNTYDPGRAIPTVVLRNEDYGRISRLLADGENVELEFDIVNRLYPEGRTSYNAIAEIPGTTDEVVMLGGHLDSWHAATGATDNAIGCAVAMEAVRILKAIRVAPRRTIRLALWSGEEQGMRGSRAYVRATVRDLRRAEGGIQQALGLHEHRLRHGSRALHDGVRSTGGRGRARRDAGAVQGSRCARRELDAEPAGGELRSLRIQRSGLPGINALQDPIEYDSYTWHSNLDTYERIVEEDVIKSAIVLAATVYHLATRDEMLPRFSNGEMPKRPGRAQ